MLKSNAILAVAVLSLCCFNNLSAAPHRDNLDEHPLEPTNSESRQASLASGGQSGFLQQPGGLGGQQNLGLQQQLGLQQAQFGSNSNQQLQQQLGGGLQQLQQAALMQQLQLQGLGGQQQQLGLAGQLQQQQQQQAALAGLGFTNVGGFGQDPLAALLGQQQQQFGLQQQLVGAGANPSFAAGGLLGLSPQQGFFGGPMLGGFGGQGLFFRNGSPEEDVEDKDSKATENTEESGKLLTRTKRGGSLTVRIEPSDTPQIRFSGGGGLTLPRTPKVRDFLIRLYVLFQSLGYAA